MLRAVLEDVCELAALAGLLAAIALFARVAAA